jgi:hypothetical protein
MKRLLTQGINFVVDFVARRCAPVLAPIVGHMARTGVGTDHCLRYGSLPMPVNFYSPVPDLGDLESRKIWDRQSDFSGIDFHPDAQKAFLLKLGQTFGQECDWPSDPTADHYRFFTKNGSFSYGCAAITHCILRHLNPQRVVEIGSGNSSLVMAAALARNARDSKKGAEYIIIDPYPGSMIKTGLPSLTKLVQERVELLDIDFFDLLGSNDVLFIDSGHVIRIGGDVNYLILEVLPRLAPGVIIHFHDIAFPYEYPRVYATNPQFRVFWTESYLLQAFLCFNNRFEILLAMNYLMIDHPEIFQTAFPLYDKNRLQTISRSFWIRRK